MEILSEERALADLAAHLDALVQIIEGGWGDYHAETSAKARGIHTPTTRAGAVHDHQIDRAARYADLTPGVRLARQEKMRGLLIGERYLLRIKKLNNALLPANWLTDQVRDFRRQRQLDGLPETFNLELGYVLDQSETNLSMVGLAYPNGDYKNLWGVNLSTRKSMTVQEVLDFARAAEEQPDEDAVVITPKTDVVPFKRKGRDEKN